MLKYLIFIPINPSDQSRFSINVKSVTQPIRSIDSIPDFYNTDSEYLNFILIKWTFLKQ